MKRYVAFLWIDSKAKGGWNDVVCAPGTTKPLSWSNPATAMFVAGACAGQMGLDARDLICEVVDLEAGEFVMNNIE